MVSARGRSRSNSNRLRSVASLDEELLTWKDKLPAQIRRGNDILCDESHFVAILMLHFPYFDCLETIHRASIY